MSVSYFDLPDSPEFLWQMRPSRPITNVVGMPHIGP